MRSATVRYESVVVGPLQVNCWLVWNTDSGDAVVVDPGGDPERILERADALDLTVHRILLTHAHVDHIAGVGAVHHATGAQVWLHSRDLGLYHSPENALLPFLDHPADLPEPDSTGVPDIPGVDVRITETPGHTPGGVTFVIDEAPPVLFCGDVLFQGSVGRTDLPGGDTATLMRSLRALLEFPDPTVVCPGHGPTTTIGAERRFNPFLREWGL